MSYCSQNFYGKTSNVTIKNINNVTYQGNTQEVPRRNTQQTNQANFFRGPSETEDTYSEALQTKRSNYNESLQTRSSNYRDMDMPVHRSLAEGTPEIVKKVAEIVDEGEDFLYCLDPGKVLIINNENFSAESSLTHRKGSYKDVQSLWSFFKGKLHWDNIEVAIDLTVDEMIEKFRLYTQFHYDGINSFFLFIMSHGTEHGINGVNGGIIKPDTILNFFSSSRCPGLASKPKIFFLQACRGDLDDKGVTMQADTHCSSSPSIITIPNMSDFLIIYPCIPRYTALRCEQRGTVYIQTLVHFLDQYFHMDHIIKILIKVNQCIARSDNYLTIKMMPCLDQRLTKKCYFKKWFKEIISGDEKMSFT